ncbi:hypothetical protein JTB14_016937 [Gonioctena quinquepunctata]|nr:hypothetical protein JTB14_016937 [Gonioctena quinquepunctata]
MDEEDEIRVSVVTKSSKKRKTTGRVIEVNQKKIRLQSHEEGHCKRLKYFEVILPEERSKILKNFKNMHSWNEQSAYLSVGYVLHLLLREDPGFLQKMAYLAPLLFTIKYDFQEAM